MAAFYKQINSDIEAGLPLVTDNYSRPKYHFTRNAAYAFAALFNLYYQKYDKAVAYASHVLGTNASSKLRDWKAFNSLSANGQIAPNAYIKRLKSKPTYCYKQFTRKQVLILDPTAWATNMRTDN